jgi:UDP-2,4-diacetamido-2,4,6-trideoxy-beta-L-altropyranose hydrolase
MNLLLRADASARIGTGHVMRCLALAQACRAAGGQAAFLSHCESKTLRHHVEAAGIRFIPLDTHHPHPADIQRTLTLLREFQTEWLVIDGYHFDPAYQQRVREAGYRLLVIDDTAHWPNYNADIVLNQNINARQLPYVVDPDTMLLLGTRYALLRHEFLAWRNWRRGTLELACKVLVTLGGSDPDNMTGKVIKALEKMEVPGLEVKIVVGPANPHLDTLRRAAKASSINLQFLTTVNDMPSLMAWAEVAVSAGGSTCWELAFMGVPNIVLVLAENQCRIAQGLEEAGVTINLGWSHQVSEDDIATKLQGLCQAGERRSHMSWLGRRLVDGEGAPRVIQSLRAAHGVTENYHADPVARQ